MELKVVCNQLATSVLKSIEQCCPLSVRTFNPDFSSNFLLPRGLASSLLLSSHSAVERLLEQQV